MRSEKRKRLEKAGWTVGDAKDFLGLSDADSALIDIRLGLAKRLRGTRLEQGLSQTEMAKRLGSSQSRVAKMEAGNVSVSLDLLIRSLLVSGLSGAEIAKAFSAVTIGQRARKSA